MNEAQVRAMRERFGERVRLGESLAAHTSFRIGGPADVMLAARTRQDLLDGIALATSLDLPWLLLGRGSNVLVEDSGYRGLIIRNETNAVEIDRSTGLVR